MAASIYSDYMVGDNVETVRMGEDLLTNLAASGTMFAFKTRKFWTAIKSAG